MDRQEMNQLAALSQIKSSSQSDMNFRSDIMRATEKIIDDQPINELLKGFPLWMVSSKSLKLTFFNETDARIMENLFEAEVCKMLRSIPPCMHNSDLYVKIGQVRMLFLANLRRSLGTQDRNKMNERIVLQSQFKQIVTSTGSQRSGFFARLLGRG